MSLLTYLSFKKKFLIIKLPYINFPAHFQQSTPVSSVYMSDAIK